MTTMTIGPRVQRQLDRLLDEGEAALEARDWPRLDALAGDALVLSPEDPDARGFRDAAARAFGGDEATSSPSGDLLRSEQRSQVLAEMMHIAASYIDQDDVHARVFAEVARLLDFDRLHVGINPEGTDHLLSYATAGDDAPPQEMPRLGLDDGPWGEVIR